MEPAGARRHDAASPTLLPPELAMHDAPRRPQRPTRLPALSSCDPDRPEPEERPAGGWFDSSLDLRLGLQVTEHMSLAALAHELPAGWLH